MLELSSYEYSFMQMFFLDIHLYRICRPSLEVSGSETKLHPQAFCLYPYAQSIQKCLTLISICKIMQIC